MKKITTIISLATLIVLIGILCVKVSIIADKSITYTHTSDQYTYLEETNLIQAALLKEALVGKNYTEVILFANNLNSEFKIVEAPNQIFIGRVCISFDGGIVTKIE